MAIGVSRRLALRNIFYTLIIPGTVTVLIPYLIVLGTGGGIRQPWGIVQTLSLAPIALGAAILLRCIWEFMVTGRGTLAPIDPPTQLVVRGLYRYVRNPMYLGAMTLLLGEAAFFESLLVLQYALAWFLVINVVVILYEEPTLRRRFGSSYEQYTRSVHRWRPTRPPA
jgi:protein-S-isoprenylcysteine O-methyltransferase Ste14